MVPIVLKFGNGHILIEDALQPLMAVCSTGHIGTIGIRLFTLTEPQVTLRSSYFDIEISLKAIHMFLLQKAEGDRIILRTLLLLVLQVLIQIQHRRSK